MTPGSDDPARPPGATATGGASGFLRKVAVAVVGAALLVLGIAFSVVFFAVALVVGAVAWGYVAWKTREVRREMRARMEEAAADPMRGAASRENARGRVIEGEAVTVPDDPR
jgi:hypothetical protein